MGTTFWQLIAFGLRSSVILLRITAADVVKRVKQWILAYHWETTYLFVAHTGVQNRFDKDSEGFHLQKKHTPRKNSFSAAAEFYLNRHENMKTLTDMSSDT